MEYNNQISDKKEERYTLAQWYLIDNIRKGKSIEIPSLKIRLNPDGSVTSLDKKLVRVLSIS